MGMSWIALRALAREEGCPDATPLAPGSTAAGGSIASCPGDGACVVTLPEAPSWVAKMAFGFEMAAVSKGTGVVAYRPDSVDVVGEMAAAN